MARQTFGQPVLGVIVLVMILLEVVSAVSSGLNSGRPSVVDHDQGSEESFRLKRSDDGGPLEIVVEQLSQRLSALEAQQQATNAQLLATAAKLSSTFVRWGRSACPAGTEKIYSGVIGGSFYNVAGAANRLCLSLNPVFDNVQIHDDYPSEIYGAEYYLLSDLNDLDAVCSVCRTPHTITIMLPGTTVCPAGWTSQYTGHLTAGYARDGPGDYLCLDGNAEGSNARNDNGALLHYTIAVCGSLPCPPYVNHKVVTCVVCSM